MTLQPINMLLSLTDDFEAARKWKLFKLLAETQKPSRKSKSLPKSNQSKFIHSSSVFKEQNESLEIHVAIKLKTLFIKENGGEVLIKQNQGIKKSFENIWLKWAKQAKEEFLNLFFALKNSP